MSVIPHKAARKPDDKSKRVNDRDKDRDKKRGPSGGKLDKLNKLNKLNKLGKLATRNAAPVVVDKPRAQIGCLDCGLCCTYIALEINGPTTVKRASEILWHLYHERVSVYRDSDDEWFVQFESRCQHLQADNKCGIYAVRPHVCREYSEETCEINSDDEGQSFYNAAEFLEFLSHNRKRVYRELNQGFAPTSPEAINALHKKRNGDFRKRLTVLRK